VIFKTLSIVLRCVTFFANLKLTVFRQPKTKSNWNYPENSCDQSHWQSG